MCCSSCCLCTFPAKRVPATREDIAQRAAGFQGKAGSCGSTDWGAAQSTTSSRGEVLDVRLCADFITLCKKVWASWTDEPPWTAYALCPDGRVCVCPRPTPWSKRGEVPVCTVKQTIQSCACWPYLSVPPLPCCHGCCRGLKRPGLKQSTLTCSWVCKRQMVSMLSH